MLHGMKVPARFTGWLMLGIVAGLAASAGSVRGQEATSQAAARQPVAISVYSPPVTGGPWLNTPSGKAIDLEDRKGKVTIVHFWTFG